MTTPERIEPWEAFPHIWKTEPEFWAWVRGGVRRAVWEKYPAKLEWKRAQMVPPPPGYKGRAKSMGSCHYCNNMFPASSLEVDHSEQAGSLNSWETLGQFIKKLLDINSNWVLACKPCHKIKSYAERMGMTFEEAEAEKRAIKFVKDNSIPKVIDFCKRYGYNNSELKNADARRKALVEIFKSNRKESIDV